MGRSLAAAVTAVLVVIAPRADAQIAFEDATAGSGIVYVGESYGVSWGDLNADGWPDLFANNHRSLPSLLVNNGNGTFSDRAREVGIWASQPNLDQHGGSWADFNNDGFMDLFVSLGATDDNQFLRNENGLLVDRTLEYGLHVYTSWPGRLPVWLDFNSDGWLDFIMMLRGKPKIFEQSGGAFTWVNAASGVNCQNSQYGQLIDLTGDGRQELICADQIEWPNKIYDTSTYPFTDVTSLLPVVGSVNDTAIGDFDGDLRNDIFQVRGALRLSGVDQVSPTSLEAQLIVDGGGEETIQFSSAGALNILIDWNRRNKSRIFIGSSGIHPDGFGPNDPIEFTLDPFNPAHQGILPHDPATEDGVWLGYDPSSGYWQISVSAGIFLNQTYWFVDSSATISDVTISGLTGPEFPTAPALLMNKATGIVEEAGVRGLGAPINCVSTVAGDFDNDMDLDLYVVCRNAVTNSANLLFENIGGGNFQLLSGAGGAAGPVGPNVGVGENVALADYDVDGFLDLLVTNGLNLYPEEPLLESRGGPYKLLRNIGNANSWIEIDLVGTISNRSGIGARVFATAGGTTQFADQNGGYHRWAQNTQRLHFGLASNNTVDLLIEWPSGIVDQFVAVPANKLYRITEGGTYDEIVLGSVDPSECGQPAFDNKTEAEVFIWKDCAIGEWHIMTTAGGGYANYVGELLSDAGFTSITPLGLEAHDFFDTTTDPNKVDFSLQIWGSGIDEFAFTIPVDNPICLNIESPSGKPALLGSARVPIALPVDLETLDICTNLPAKVSVNNVSVNETAGSVEFAVSLLTESPNTVTVDFATENVTASSPADYQQTSGTLTFLPGEITKVVPVLINDDAVGEGDETFQLSMSNPVNATLVSAAGTATILDNELSPCGKPTISGGQEAGIFVWKDCAAGQWHVTGTAGGSYANWSGTLTSGGAFASVVAVDIEAHDTLDNSVASEIVFQLQIWGGGFDEFSASAAPGLGICMDLPGSTVFFGPGKVPVSPPFDLDTLAFCTP